MCPMNQKLAQEQLSPSCSSSNPGPNGPPSTNKPMTPEFQSVQGHPPASEFSMDSMAQEESQQSFIQTQIESLTQMDCTQQSQTLEETSTSMTPLSPPASMPWARLVPCVPSKDNIPVDLIVGQSEYWLGRSSAKCEIPIKPGTSLSKKEQIMLGWAHSMISNQHCRIVNLLTSRSNGNNSDTVVNEDDMDEDNVDVDHDKDDNHKRSQFNSMEDASGQTPAGPQILLEDHSGNGTVVNQSVHLRKGHQRLLHSGDEICLVNPDAMRKRIPSSRRLRQVLQHYTYVLVLSNKPRRPCVNPRAMNYTGTQLPSSPVDRGIASPRSARRIEANYEIREILGDGTSGQVRKAIHRQSGKEYAVKVISLRRQLDLTSMEHEVDLMQSLDHPYIVQLVDVFVHHGIAMYLVMELVAGGDLFDCIVQQERYSEVNARRVMRRLLSAVYYLHQTKNIVHRDLKPENILCASPTHVKLADFGLAKIIQGDGLKTFCGTPQYFAPEVLQRRTTVAGSGRYGKPADIWSLGVILYILLTGRPPFEAELDPMQAFHDLDFDDPVWKDIPHAQELVQQMLRLDPKRRVTITQACEHPWINIKDGDTHVHPLDDPAVTGRKRLFSEPKESQADENQAKLSSEEDTDSVVSKESRLSKEDFAAAATSHHRVESVHFLNANDIGQADDPETEGSNASPSKMEEETSTKNCAAENEGGGAMTTNNFTDKRPSNVDGDHLLDGYKPCNHGNPASPTTLEANHNTSASPDNAMTDLMARELSVTPSECADEDLPRSPLAAMNLNERSNRFRAQVLGHTQPPSRNDGAASPGGGTSQQSSQIAVTPTASNVRTTETVQQTETTFCEEEVEEDPILSQFSSDPSSLESFPDSPAKAENAPVLGPKSSKKAAGKNTSESARMKKKKRKRSHQNDDKDNEADDDDDEDDKNRRSNHSRQVRQTKLSAWFVSKKTKRDGGK